MTPLQSFVLLVVAAGVLLAPTADATLANRVGGPGLALLYTFDANAGTVVADQTGAGGAKGDPWDQTLNRYRTIAVFGGRGLLAECQSIAVWLCYR